MLNIFRKGYEEINTLNLHGDFNVGYLEIEDRRMTGNVIQNVALIS